MRILSRSVLALALLGLIAAPVRAQAPGVDIRLNPRIGLYTPLTNLGEVTDGTATAALELDNSLALGLGLEFDFAALPFGVRANLDYASSSSVNFEDGPDISDTNEVTMLAVVGDVIYRPLPRVVVIQPYFFAGGGLKSYDFQFDNVGDEDFIDNETDPTFHLGGGVDFGFGPLALNAEISDYISSFEPEGSDDSEMQHDLFVTLGFSIGLL
jgi:hypothetical protein